MPQGLHQQIPHATGGTSPTDCMLPTHRHSSPTALDVGPHSTFAAGLWAVLLHHVTWVLKSPGTMDCIAPYYTTLPPAVGAYSRSQKKEESPEAPAAAAARAIWAVAAGWEPRSHVLTPDLSWIALSNLGIRSWKK